jgi:AcrR family transcriptional regulator
MGTNAGRLSRRTPTQTRGARRVEAILDAASTLLAEGGYATLTLTDVAEKSGSAIGSLYRFFSNKDQLVDAVADRIARRYRTLPGAVLDASLASVSVEVFVHALIAPLAALAIESPAVAEVMDRIIARTPSLDSEVTSRLDAILAARSPALATAERRLVVRVMAEIVRTAMRVVARTPGNRQRTVIAEFETLIAAYMRARLGEPPEP